MNKKELIKILADELKNIQEKRNHFNAKRKAYNLYKIVVESFQTKDIEELRMAAHAMPYLLEEMVPLSSTKELEMRLLNSILKLKSSLDEQEFQKNYQELNKSILVLKNTKKRLKKIINEEKEPIYRLWDLEKQYCFLLKKLKYGGYISPVEIALIKNLTKEKSKEETADIFKSIQIQNEQYKIPSIAPNKSVSAVLKTELKSPLITQEEKNEYAYLNEKVHEIYTKLEITTDAEKVHAYLQALNTCFATPEEFCYVLKMLMYQYIDNLYEDIEDMNKFANDKEFQKIIMNSYRNHTKVYYPLEQYFKKMKSTSELQIVRKGN